MPYVSVVVSTRNRAAMLVDCLRTIMADRSPVPRELIVVDNASTDDTPEVVRAAGELRGDVPVRYLVEARLGLSHARNTGTDAARGQLILFTDDDILVEDGWAAAFARAFDDERVGGAGGRVLPSWPHEPPTWLRGPHAELLTLIDQGAEPRVLIPPDHPMGGNMAVRGDIARRLAPAFDTTLGHQGGLRVAQEEVAFMRRVGATHDIAYVPDAIVRHRVLPERIDLTYLRNAFFQLGVGLGRMERLENANLLSLPRRAIRATRSATTVSRIRVRNGRSERSGPETWSEMQAYCSAGRHFELLFGRLPALTERVARRISRPSVRQ